MILRQHTVSEFSGIPHSEISALIHAFPQGITAFDVETTGLSPLQDRIIEISAVKIRPNRGVRVFSNLVNPLRHIPKITQDIHHISDEMVKDSPTMDSVLEEFLSFNSTTPLIGHNAKFDAGFLASAMHFNGSEFLDIPIYCSLQIAKDSFKKMPNYKLGTLAKELNITLINQHRALDDAIVSLRLFAQSIIQLKLKNQTQLIKKSYLFTMKDFSKKAEFEIPKKLKEIRDNISRQKPLEIKYKGGSHRGSFRAIKPIAFLPMPHGTVLYALCLISNQHKSFKLNKITDIKQVKQ